MEPKGKFLFVINPIAGGIDKTEIVDSVRNYAKEHAIELAEYETTGEGDEKKIRQLYEQLKPSRILVAGGDGNIKMVAEAVEHHDVTIGVIPAGSANGLSVDLEIPAEPEEYLRIAFSGKAMEMDMVSINGKKSLHLSDIGLNAELIKNYENSSIRGKLGYALQAINTLTGLEDPFTAKVTANGNTIETVARMIVIANTNRYGTGVTINPVGKMDDGKFEIVILRNLDLVVMGKILSGNMPLDTGDVEIISAEEATITTDAPVHFQIDGEYCDEADKLDIKILHRQMKVAVP